MTYHALSLKQPWATLLVHGLKTIEIRRWRTSYRGSLLIHAARIDDPCPEAWRHVPPHLLDAVRLKGGVVGIADLTECRFYRNLTEFVADASLHLNEPEWFDPKGLYGFCFERPRPLPYRQVPGYVRIFSLQLDDLNLSLASPEVVGPDAVSRRFDSLGRSLGKRT